MKKLLFLFLPLLLTGCVFNSAEEQVTHVRDLCDVSGGTWLEAYQECEDINKEWCEQNLGSYNMCGSACRHDADADFCTERCVPFCEWEDGYSALKMDLESPSNNELVGSPINIFGEAPGVWFFEGDFPVELVAPSGKVISKGYVTADGEWMTAEMVKFIGQLKYEKPDGVDSAMLRLMRDNPSGLPENDEVYEIPVKLR